MSDDFSLKDIPAEDALVFIGKVLSINDGFTDLYAGIWDSIWWRTDDEYAPVTFWVNCNDLFYWACADCETITTENFDLILQTVNDVAAAMGAVSPRSRDKNVPFKETYDAWKSVGGYAAELWCCRVRGMRPQQPCYKNIPDVLKPFFDAAGPERDRKSEG